MSISAVSWAIAQDIGQPSVKLVLMTLAHYANKDDWTAFREKSALVKDTGLSIKTVKTSLRQLREEGYLEDTGERKGVTNQIVVFRLCAERGEAIAPLMPDERGETVAPVTETKGGNLGHERGVIQGTKGGQFRDASIEEPEEPDEGTTLLCAREVTEKVSELARADPVKSPSWMAAQPIVTVWLQRGADPELDIYPTIRRLMARFANGHDPPSPNYFTKAVDEARVNRIEALNAPEPTPNDRRNRTVSKQSELPPSIAALSGGFDRGG